MRREVVLNLLDVLFTQINMLCTLLVNDSLYFKFRALNFACIAVLSLPFIRR